MNKKMVSKLLNQLSKISLGVVLILFWGWMYLRVPQLFPQNTEAFRAIITTYILFTALIFSFDAIASKKTERPLFTIGFLKAFPKFLLFAGIGLGIMFLFNLIITGESLPNIFQAIKGIGIGVLLLHAFFVATLEEKIFRGWFPNELRARGISRNFVWISSAIVFAFFHYLLNGELLTILIYIPLGLVFMAVKQKWSPRTDMANSGVHFAWNVFILGFMSGI